MANPRFPLYIVSKGRADTRLTSKALERTGVPYSIVIEEQEYDNYAAVIDPKKIIVLNKKYQDEYDTCDTLGDTVGKGPGAARNFIWDHAIANGHEWHWVMDDNIRKFHRLNKNLKIPVSDGTIFRCMEDFCLRYKNVAMAGPNYHMFAPRKTKLPPYVLNTKIYSCNLIRNNIPFRWRGRFNEDVILSLDILKKGWCTIQFNAFLQCKMWTQQVKGGNTETYKKHGTLLKSKMMMLTHPDVCRIVWKFNRWHHSVNYGGFTQRLEKKDNLEIKSGVDNYGMKLFKIGSSVL